MAARDGDKGKIISTIEPDPDNPEETFLYPRMFKLRKWLRKIRPGSAEIKLDFTLGVYFLSELSFDDHDMGVFNIQYVDCLIDLNRPNRKIDWSSPAAAIERRALRPAPDSMIGYLRGFADLDDWNLQALSESHLSFLSEQSSLKIFSNEDFGLFSSAGESEDDFRRTCYDYALAEKSERAQELGTVMERKLHQVLGRLREEAAAPGGGASGEVAQAGLEAFTLAAKSLLTKAVTDFTQTAHETPAEKLDPDDNPPSELAREADRLAVSLEGHDAEFHRFASELIQCLSEIETDVQGRAGNIIATVVPLSRCSIRLLRICRVWLPFWNVEFRSADRDRKIRIKAF